jgi:hypothetical protein
MSVPYVASNELIVIKYLKLDNIIGFCGQIKAIAL